MEESSLRYEKALKIHFIAFVLFFMLCYVAAGTVNTPLYFFDVLQYAELSLR